MKHSYCWNLNSGDRQPKMWLLQWSQSGPCKNQNENNLQIPSVHEHNSEKNNNLGIITVVIVHFFIFQPKDSKLWYSFGYLVYLVWSQQVFLNTLVNIMLDGFYPRPLPRPIFGVTLAHPINIHTEPFLLLTARDVTLPRKTFSVS